eukprot:Nk52_evm27s621 gene=Nk52_evmTU27s621
MEQTADWAKIQDTFYRKVELYSMLWQKVELSNYRVCGAPFGGPLAITRDDRKVLKAGMMGFVAKSEVVIFSASGRTLGVIPWDYGHIVGMDWSDNEQLVLLTEDGAVRMYDIKGEFVKTFSIGRDAKSQGLIDCRMWGGGLVCLTSEFKFYAVTNFSEPRPRLLSQIPDMDSPPTSWSIVEPMFTLGRHVEAIVGRDSTVFVVDVNEAQDQQMNSGSFTQMTVSPNGKLIALFSVTGVLSVVSTDFQKSFTEYNSKTNVTPSQLCWCGTDSVIAAWDNEVLMVGPFGGVKRYTYDSSVFLIPEFDGIRILSNETHEFLQKVPSCVEETFKFGSTDPSAMLYDSAEHFDRKSPKADELIRSIKPQLGEAVNTCIEAAGHEFVSANQKALLKAASFGKCFLDFYSPDRFVDVCRTLRILNAVRDESIGIGISFSQYERLSAEVLINRLVIRHEHLLAFKICEFLGVKADRVLVHWACAKVKQSEDSDVICKAIVTKIGSTKGVAYAEIAKTAYKFGRPELATKLLEHEPRAADQVPLLISMQEDELALAKAIESGDTDLVYLVLLHLKKKLNVGTFFRLIHNKPVACDLLVRYCKAHDMELLSNFYYQDDRTVDRADIILQKAYEKEELSERLKDLKLARGMYQESKDMGFMEKAVDEQIKLLYVQDELERALKRDFVDLSLSDTIGRCIECGAGDRAMQLKKDFRVTDRNFWWIKIQALAMTHKWTELETFSRSKKSPIGYAPFVEACIKANARGQALSYIPKLPAEERIPFYIAINAYQEAAELAFELKSVERLEEIKKYCSRRKDLIGEIDNMMNQLTLRR